MVEALIKYKGLSDIAVAAIIGIKPDILYDSAPTRFINALTGLRMTTAATAPGFNHALACMTAAIGVGGLLASRCGPAAHPPIVAMNLTGAALALITCATPDEWGLSNSSMLFAALVNTAFCGIYYFLSNSKGSKGRKSS